MSGSREKITEIMTSRGMMPANRSGITMSVQEVQDKVNQEAGAQPAVAVPTATPRQAADNASLNINGMGNTGRGNFYGAVGAGGQIANPMAFMAAAPGAYNNIYAPAMQQTMNELLNQKPFQYDVNADGLYQQIKDNYVKQGRQAMMDTQGQAAALTGGYGNSYAAQAGQQAYQESLGNLAGMIPELQQMAYQQYLQDQDNKRNNLEAMNKLEAQDYARWADEQEKYQQMLATMPMAGAGGGGMSEMDARSIASLIGSQMAQANAGKGAGDIDLGMLQALNGALADGSITKEQYDAARNMIWNNVNDSTKNLFLSTAIGSGTMPSVGVNMAGTKATGVSGNNYGNVVNANAGSKALNEGLNTGNNTYNGLFSFKKH